MARVRPLLLFLALAGCGAEQQPATVFPTDFEPGPPLGDPPAADPRAPGASYLASVAPRFAAPWGAFLDDLRLRLPPGHALNRPGLSVRLALELDAQGDLIVLRVAAPSGSQAFDEAAVEVAREAMPLPRPPTDLLSDDDHLHLDWRFSRDARQAGPATALMRRVEWPLERALPALLARRRVGDAARRVAAAAAHAGDGAEVALVARFREVCAAAVDQALASDESARQQAGVAAAVAAELTSAVPALRRLASDSIDPAVRRAALSALGLLRDRASIPLLRQVALVEIGQGSENSGAAAAALFAMGQDGDVRAATTARLRSPSELGRWTALAVMTYVPTPEAVPDLIGLLRGNGRAARAERIAAASALGAVAAHTGQGAQPAMTALTDCLAAADGAQRAACAQAIAGAARAAGWSAATARKLTLLLRDRDERVRAAATLAAARLDPERFARSMTALSRERSDLVLAALAEGLAQVPGHRAAARLVRLTASARLPVRLAATRSLVGRSEPRAGETLARLAGHRDAEIRAIAVRGERRPAALRAALSDEAPEVRAAALAGLVEIEGRWRTLAAAADLLAELPAASAERVLVARAWLAP
ncbi:MAG TPA: TonB family protein [Kofleriaceae bacterium]|nr:TonB family protein [Kofleriaceae bacterium]